MNKLADKYNNTYHCSISKKVIHADYSILTDEIESSHKAPKCKVGDIIRITKYNNVFTKGYTEHWSR